MLFHNEKLDHLKRIEVDAGIDYQDENIKQFALQMILHSARPCAPRPSYSPA
jgi:NADPH-dependent curcumin reductase CurA